MSKFFRGSKDRVKKTITDKAKDAHDALDRLSPSDIRDLAKDLRRPTPGGWHGAGMLK